MGVLGVTGRFSESRGRLDQTEHTASPYLKMYAECRKNHEKLENLKIKVCIQKMSFELKVIQYCILNSAFSII